MENQPHLLADAAGVAHACMLVDTSNFKIDIKLTMTK
jgi:hypothetical protein